MNEYYVETMKTKKIYDDYIYHMLSHSDFFSVVYYRLRKESPLNKYLKEYKKALRPYILHAENAHKWPNMETWDKRSVYRLAFYYADMKCYDILTRVNDIFEWDYPRAPMDLCFYKDGYCWFALTAHEYDAFVYTNNEKDIQELRELGVTVEFSEDNARLFHYDLEKEMNHYRTKILNKKNSSK